MATYILHNRHRADECQALEEEVPWPESLAGIEMLCTCPSGEHGGILAVEAANADEALARLTPRFRLGTRAYEGDVFVIGKDIPVG